MGSNARIDRISDLDPAEAKWIGLHKINWTDHAGEKRLWEVASRKTRGSSGVDAVAMVPILLYPSKPASVLIIHQYRPPASGVCIEFPAGLVDEGESIETAAVRELKEETGLVGRVVELCPTVVSDPGMTTANMQLAVVEVNMKEGEDPPKQDLQEAEWIEREIVPLSGLYSRLLQLKSEGSHVDSKLFHWAHGFNFATIVANRY